VAEVSRKVLGWRLRAAPYLYTAFYDSHTRGCPIARPLFFAFPADAATAALKEQWMMGVAPLTSCLISLSYVCRILLGCRRGSRPHGVAAGVAVCVPYGHSALGFGNPANLVILFALLAASACTLVSGKTACGL